ncbi:MAG: peptidoglycan-binding protein [Pirellulaceae bacterium]|nr:peptidoglycan-binding protein [Pirellulaceae bacterium]
MKNSVGKNGTNHASDVRIIQDLLNRFIKAGKLPGDVLVVDGDCGKYTKAAIKWFQAIFLGHKSPDGRVDPGGPTLSALCGPITQPMKGDPSDGLLQSVVSTLMTPVLNNVYFTMGAYQIRSGDYQMLGDRFANRRLVAFYDPGKGNSAEYFHTNSGDLGGYMMLGFTSAMTAFQQSIVVHEATHALCDARGVDMYSEDVEALAHLAQSMYYYSVGGRDFPVSLVSTKSVLNHCISIIDHMKTTGTRTVTSQDRLELYRLVRLLPSVKPSWGFKFDGL